MIKAIVAVDKMGGVGVGDNLAIINKLDQAFFSGYTMGQTCVVGWNTYGQVRTLKGRDIMLDRRNTLPQHIITDGDIVVIGGVKTYIKYAEYTQELLVTFFEDENKDCDKFLDVCATYSHLTKREVVYNGLRSDTPFRIERWTLPQEERPF